MKFLFLPLFMLLLAGCADKQDTEKQAAATSYPFQNPELSAEQRAEDLVSRLTTPEKISQLFNDSPGIERLGIPPYDWWNEALHGVARAGKATVFPQAIGLAATFDEDLMFRFATAVSDEGRAKYHYLINHDVHTIYGGLTFWTPNINIFRDPRWGRGQETYGEDPYLTGRMAVNFVNGMQGDDPHYLKTVATVKHYAVHSGPEISRHIDNYTPSRKDLYETYLPAFASTVKEAHVASLMCAYNRVDGAPACGSTELLQDILRDQMGFDGYVTSDCGAVADFYDSKNHHVVGSPEEAAAWALKAGTDVECGDNHGDTMVSLNRALYQGLVSEKDIDKAVTRLFVARIKLGMFDPQDKVPYSSIPMSVVASKEHLDLSLEAAHKSLVLLKNNGLLPLKPGIKVALIGPNADNQEVLIGNYYGSPTHPTTALQGLKDRLGESNVFYAPGSAQTGEVFGNATVVPSDVLFHYDDNKTLQPGLNGRYYLNPTNPYLLKQYTDADFAEPAMTRIDSNVDFYWDLSPINRAIEENYSVVWTGVLKAPRTSTYQFDANNRAVVKINGEWVDEHQGIDLKQGQLYDIEVRYAIQRNWSRNAMQGNVRLTWVDTKTDMVADALAAAKKADVIIFAGGIDAHLEGEEMPLELDGFMHGDRTHIDLPKVQTDLLKKLKATGKPVVLVNFSGSAMAMNWENDNLDAIVQAFYPGELAGKALADVLWGDVNPSGRLPVTFYRGVSDLPAFTDYSMQNRTYKYYKGTPLYPFGYGLSYTSFAYSDMKVDDTHPADQPLVIGGTVTNAGDRAGEEVSQLYLSFLDEPAPAAIRELKGFARSKLEPGKSAELQFTLKPEQLTYVDADGKSQVYHGRLEITLGAGQEGYVKDGELLKKTIQLQ